MSAHADADVAKGRYALEVGKPRTILNADRKQLPSCGALAEAFIVKHTTFEIVYDENIRIDGAKWPRDRSTTEKNVGATRDDLLKDIYVNIIFWNTGKSGNGELTILGMNDNGSPRCANSVELFGTFSSSWRKLSK